MVLATVRGVERVGVDVEVGKVRGNTGEFISLGGILALLQGPSSSWYELLDCTHHEGIASSCSRFDQGLCNASVYEPPIGSHKATRSGAIWCGKRVGASSAINEVGGSIRDMAAKMSE